ncbi:MAG: aldo/keto reductase [Egibacteraceae bacterium]
MVTLGLGTYRVRGSVADAVRMALAEGCPLIDTAPNYGHGTAQQQIGEVMGAGRDHGPLTVSSKVGFLTAGIRDDAQAAGVLPPQSLAGHCIQSGYLRWQLDRTLAELHAPRLGVLYLHNPDHHHDGDPGALLGRVRAAFAACEEAHDARLIDAYGVATWHGLAGDRRPLAFTVSDLVRTARDVAGDAHRFGAVQLPVNLVRLSALTRAVRHGDGPLVDAENAGIQVAVSAPLHGGELLDLVSADLAELIRPELSPAQACLLVAASAPGVSSVLVSTGDADHWRQAADVVNTVPKLPARDLRRIVDVLDPRP